MKLSFLFLACACSVSALKGDIECIGRDGRVKIVESQRINDGEFHVTRSSPMTSGEHVYFPLSRSLSLPPSLHIDYCDCEGDGLDEPLTSACSGMPVMVIS
jgi:hypothetical protein